MVTTDPRPTVIGGHATSLDTVAALLGPGDGRTLSFSAVGPSDAPRFLLPAPRRAAVGACFGYNRLRPRSLRLKRAAVGTAVAVGARTAVAHRYEVSGPATDPVAGDVPLIDMVAEVLDEPDPVVAVGLGTLDHWWKPVLQVFSSRGRPLGYVKVGWTPITAELVRTEGRSLEAYAASPVVGLIAPRLVHRGTWGACEIVITAPMPRRVRRMDGLLPPPVPRSVASLDGPTRRVELARTGFWRSTVADLAEGIGHRTDATIRDLVERVGDLAGATTVTEGRWHGDWVPWNQGSVDGLLVAWDWEYSSTGMPAGLDDLQGAYQSYHLLASVEPEESLVRSVDHARACDGAGPELDAVAAAHPLLLAARIHRATRSGTSIGPADEAVLDAVVTVATARSARRGHAS